MRFAMMVLYGAGIAPLKDHGCKSRTEGYSRVSIVALRRIRTAKTGVQFLHSAPKPAVLKYGLVKLANSWQILGNGLPW